MKIINLPILDKELILQECQDFRKKNFSPAPECLTGLYYLKAERLQMIFKEHLEQYGVDVKITRGWAHFLSNGGKRASHQHTAITGLYYLHIPKNSAKMWFDDTQEMITPEEDDFMMFETMKPHGITEHDNAEDRWAIAFECMLVNNHER